VLPYKGYDALLEFGRSSYTASLVARSATQGGGDFEHASVTRHFNSDDSAVIEYYKMSPRYGTTVLPYGIPLNVWGVAWAYPGPWLKGTYQLVGNAFGGSNREGLHAFGTVVRGPWRVSAGAYSYRQIDPSTVENLMSPGFVEVDYLALAPNDVQFGRTKGLDAYAAWTRSRDTISLDYASDSQFRGHAPGVLVDRVEMHYPQMILAEQHRFSPRLLTNVGYARYEASGFWTSTPVHGVEAYGFLNVEADLGRLGQLLIQFRRYGVKGDPSIPGGPPPTLTGTSLVVDHHFSI
jgi:hypothetical protein